MLGRLARLLGWQRNPLRRRADRIEAAVITGLLVVFLIAGPILAIVAGRLTDDFELRQQRAERSWRQVPATLLQSPAAAIGTAYGTSGSWAPARWQAPGGGPRTGLVPAPLNAPAGQRVPIWEDASGRLEVMPVTQLDIDCDVTLAAAITPMLLACLLVIAGWSARQLLDRQRLAGWERAWRTVGPRWTRQP
jgi:hypothetical protein